MLVPLWPSRTSPSPSARSCATSSHRLGYRDKIRRGAGRRGVGAPRGAADQQPHRPGVGERPDALRPRPLGPVAAPAPPPAQAVVRAPQPPARRLRDRRDRLPLDRSLAMPLAYHADAGQKYDQQVENARAYILPFIEAAVPRRRASACSKSGAARRASSTPSSSAAVRARAWTSPRARIAHARETLAAPIAEGRLTLIDGDVHDPAVSAQLDGGFDIVLMKDTIEHIYGHYEIMARVPRLPRARRRALRRVSAVADAVRRAPADDGLGGGQATVLPPPAAPGLPGAPQALRRERAPGRGADGDRRHAALDCGLRGRGRGGRVTRSSGGELYLVNPIYRYKFGLTPRRQLPGLRSLPWLRDFVTTTCYYLVRPV